MKYGLIGENVSGSFSSLIHKDLGYNYELKSINVNELSDFLTKREFLGINVTIPYKSEVIKHLDYIDQKVSEIGSCNTIVNHDGKLFGYNTDYFGFEYSLMINHVNIKGKVIAILGSGGTKKTVFRVLMNHGAKSVIIVSRQKGMNYIDYEQLKSHSEIQIIINTTPNGMIGRTDDDLVDLSCFPKLECVIDVIYRPLKTKLLLQAENLKIKYFDGLLMLVAQAIKASELFQNRKYNDLQILKEYEKMKSYLTNIVLIGMPASGKTHNGALLAKKIGREFIDIDEYIENKYHKQIKEIFLENGEEYFRKIEHEAVMEIGGQFNKVISTGGGVIKDQKNIDCLKKNSIIIFLDRDVNKVNVHSDKRPLIKSVDDLSKLYIERYPLYLHACDAVVKNVENFDQNIKNLEMKFYEIINN